MSQVASQNTLDLSGFTGSERWYRHPLVTSLVYTDGGKYVAERAGAYWLIDKIVTAQLAAPHQPEVFQVWELKVTERTGVLTCEDGDDRLISSEALIFTDFPEPGVTIWFTDNTLLLPSEY